MIPTWVMKLTPLLRLVCSASIFMPSSWDGVRVSSSSVKSHCVCDAWRTGFGSAGRGRFCEECDGAEAMTVSRRSSCRGSITLSCESSWYNVSARCLSESALDYKRSSVKSYLFEEDSCAGRADRTWCCVSVLPSQQGDARIACIMSSYQT